MTGMVILLTRCQTLCEQTQAPWPPTENEDQIHPENEQISGGRKIGLDTSFYNKKS